MKWLGTNWKMNSLRPQTRRYTERLSEFRIGDGAGADLQLFIIPPATSISTAAEVLAGTDVYVGVQNVHWEDSGAYTGEVSVPMAAECGARIVEIGHSERRHIFGETDEQVNRKVRATLRHGLIPLVCVGERLEERQFHTTEEYIARQLKVALAEVGADEVRTVWIAYEPVWAIGVGGTPAEPEYAEAVHAHIRRTLETLYGPEATRGIPIIYGGSVDVENSCAYTKLPNVDGLFVGRAALNVENFIRLAEDMG
jgi:L-erythrulose 1-phosphate isomerase